ncbi:MAG: DUF6978 family protein [Carboxydocellales bacterium]
MLTQAEIDLLLNMLKLLVDKGNVNFPTVASYKCLDIVSQDGKEKFIIDINRKGRIKISKCTYQERYRKDDILLRLDIDGPPHTNPDGQEVPPNHLHIYKEGYGDSWAYPVPPDMFSNPGDLVTTLIEFLQYCRVTNITDISIQGGMVL